MSSPRRSFIRVAAVLSLFAAFAAEAPAAPVTAEDPTIERIQALRKATWRWQRLMRVSLTPANYRAEASPSASFRAWVLEHWREEARNARHAGLNPPRLGSWLCIHRHEGPWKANTGNGYYGGLQMDRAFQRAWGADLLRRKGAANRWLPIEQIWVAERAYRSGLGFRPWPNTARYCGLL
ncbi:MAG: transglycosylase family protein [Actinobacteria bacterium]|nr:transglycosylase family protein [Actinomycetota bacterium]